MMKEAADLLEQLQADLAAAQASLKRIDDHLGLGGMQDGAFIVGQLRARDEELAAAQARLAEVTQERDLALEGLDAPCPDCDALKQAETTLAAIRTKVIDLRELAYRWVGDGERRHDLAQTRAYNLRADTLTEVLALLDAPPSPEKG
jgi:uncharacterized protein (DUF1778 family)